MEEEPRSVMIAFIHGIVSFIRIFLVSVKMVKTASWLTDINPSSDLAFLMFTLSLLFTCNHDLVIWF